MNSGSEPLPLEEDQDLENVTRHRDRTWPLLAVMLLVNLAASLYQLPLNRVVERRLCYEYYSFHDPRRLQPGGRVDESLCKVDVVQQRLGWILGVMETAWVVGDFVMTIPLGFVAENYGRRPVFFLNLVPRLAMLIWAIVVGHFDHALPTKAIVASPFLSVLGGDCVFNSLTYALAAGLTDDHRRRATYFGYMSSVTYVVALLGPALASATMSLALWLPLWIGVLLLLLAVPIIAYLPVGRDHGSHGRDQARGEQSQPLLSSPLLKASDARESFLHSLSERFRSLRAIVASHPRNFGLLLLSFFLTSLASSDTKLLLQYISKRYNWTFVAAGYLLSAKAVVNFTLLAVVIPRLLARRFSHGRNSQLSDSINLRYARLCLVVSMVGAFSIATAMSLWLLFPALIIYALGSALPIFTLSLLKASSVSPPHRDSAATETQVFSIVMLVKTAGSLVGAPLMAGLWIRGISLGGAALGIPYMISSAAYVAALVVLSGMSL